MVYEKLGKISVEKITKREETCRKEVSKRQGHKDE